MGGTEGGVTKHWPEGEVMPIYDAAMKYQAEGKELVVFAGEQYGTGSSRDWAAKGTVLLGVRAVLADSFERIHRSNLIGMGVLPLQLPKGHGWKDLGMKGNEVVTIRDVAHIKPRQTVEVLVEFPDGEETVIGAKLRIDTENELEYY